MGILLEQRTQRDVAASSGGRDFRQKTTGWHKSYRLPLGASIYGQKQISRALAKLWEASPTPMQST
jgi:hypothetical protein